MKTTIRFENVSKQYNLGLTRTSLPAAIKGWFRRVNGRVAEQAAADKKFWALRDLSFELNQGESLALIGANGAGKTTALKLLANITKPTSGDIHINGKLSALIELGAGFHPDLTGRENIFLNGTILGLKREEIEQRLDEIIAFSELERFIDTPVKRYSSGMSVRLGFAVAACIEPEILLVDEVLAVGDASFRQKCMDRIHEMLNKGTSIVFVSHNLWLVQAVCSRAIYLEKGQLKYIGETSKAIALYDRTINEERASKLDREVPDSEQLQITDIEITDVNVVKLDGTTGDFNNDEEAEVRIHYSALEDIEVVNVVVRVIRSDGLSACMMRTSLDEFPLSIERGTGIVSLLLDPLQLYGGSYYVQAIIRDANDSYPLADKYSEWFYVNGSVLSHQEMNGVFEPERRWSHKPLPAVTNNDF